LCRRGRRYLRSGSAYADMDRWSGSSSGIDRTNLLKFSVFQFRTHEKNILFSEESWKNVIYADEKLSAFFGRNYRKE